MVLINTRFYVGDELTRQSFFELVKSWVDSSSYINISVDDYDFSTDETQYDDDNNKLFIANYNDRFIVSHTCLDDDATYETVYVLDDVSDKHSLYVHQEKTFTKAQLGSYRSVVRVPNVIKSLFWNEFGGDDNGIITCGDPITLRKSDVALAKKIIDNSGDFLNPVVYVSPQSGTGHYDVNCDFIAQELEGQAHVVVENSPVVASAVQKATDGNNPYNGAVKIFVPGSEAKTLLCKGKGFNYEVIDCVRDMLAHVTVDNSFNPTKLRQAHMISKLGGGDSELSRLCEEMLNDKDSEIRALKEELTVAKQELMAVNAKAANLQDGFNKSDSIDRGVVFEVVENNLYEDEIKTVILKVLQKERDSMKDDANLSHSRKFDILSDILDHNFPCTTDADLIECIRSTLKDGTLTREGIGCLQASGFEVEKSDRNGHYKVSYKGDKRYTTVVSSTPSDRRGGKNSISEFVNVLFGY